MVVWCSSIIVVMRIAVGLVVSPQYFDVPHSARLPRLPPRSCCPGVVMEPVDSAVQQHLRQRVVYRGRAGTMSWSDTKEDDADYPGGRPFTNSQLAIERGGVV
jgi:hypothetical protein